MRPEAYVALAQTQYDHWWFVGRRKIISQIIKGLILPPHADILEIGAGMGGNLEMLSQFGTVSAVEQDSYARQWIEEKTGFTALPGLLPHDLPFTDKKFDLICLLDVLEHVEADGAALAALRGFLKPGGKLLLTVPAFQWLWSRYDEKVHHFRRYNKTLIIQRSSEAGLRVQRLSYFSMILFPLVVLARLWDRLRAESESLSGEKTPPPVLNWSLRTIFTSETLLLRYRNLPFGSSLLAILTSKQG